MNAMPRPARFGLLLAAGVFLAGLWAAPPAAAQQQPGAYSRQQMPQSRNPGGPGPGNRGPGGWHPGGIGIGIGVGALLPYLVPPRQAAPYQEPVYLDDDEDDIAPRRHRQPKAAHPAKRPPKRPPATAARGGRPSGLPPAGETRFVPDEVMFETRAGLKPQQLDALMRRQRLTRLAEQRFGLLNATIHRARIPAGRSVRAALTALQRERGVSFAQPNYIYTLQQAAETASAVPATAPKPPELLPQYAVEALDLAAAHRIAKGGKVLVALIDSGVDTGHPELAGAIAASMDALEEASIAPDTHGTAMAGAIVAHQQMRSVAPEAELLAARAFGGAAAKPGAQGTSYHILRALDWAHERKARIVNMSFAGPSDPLLKRMLAAASKQDMILIAAGGNAGPKAAALYPAADPAVIAVTASDAESRLYTMANRGSYIVLAAPGVDVLAAAPHAAYDFSTGTSIATAQISGIVALMLEKRPDLSAAAIRKALIGSAKPLADNAKVLQADAAGALKAIGAAVP